MESNRAARRVKPTAHERRIMEQLREHNIRITNMETVVSDVADIKEAILKIAKYASRSFKYGLPAIISALVASGIVDGKVATFLNHLFT